VEVPAIPRSSGDVGIYPPWSETWSGERFLLKLDNYWGVAIFATDENLSALRKCKEVFIDGTFRSTPAPFKQYVTMHGKYHGRVLSLVSCLMTGKTTGHYRKVFKVLKQSIRRITHHRFQPQKLICDFEQSLIIAANTELPTAHVTGCYFHYCQSLYRKIQELGLHQPFRTDMQLQKAVRMILAIGYIPVAIIRMAFTQFRTTRGVVQLTQTYPLLNDFLDYVWAIYFIGPFPPIMWNVYNRDASNRTNNHVEGLCTGVNKLDIIGPEQTKRH
jgi:hypothetical protein